MPHKGTSKGGYKSTAKHPMGKMPKGAHKMPSGKMMKDSKMKKHRK